MTYGGLEASVWQRCLSDSGLSLRLTALRALSKMGEVGCRALLSGPSFNQPDLAYPWVWALCRCADPDLLPQIRLTGHPSQTLLARARFLMRRELRPHRWIVKRSRFECLELLARSEHPLQTLACTVRLLELHGESSIPALLELIRRRDDKAECAAWALGRLGRVAVAEIVGEYRLASPRVRRHLAMALWYVGPAAEKAVPLLLKDRHAQAFAALLAMEERASLAMIEARWGPVWLDEKAVQALAAIAFSEADRDFAAACLGGFGPAAGQSLPIMLQLAADSDPNVRRCLAAGLAWGGRADAAEVLEQLGVAPRTADPRGRADLLEQALSDNPSARNPALQQLAEVGFPSDCDVSIKNLLQRLEGLPLVWTLEALARTRPFPVSTQPQILHHLLGEVDPVRLSAARASRLLPDSPQLRAAWRKCLWADTDPVVNEAATALARTGLSLRELNLTSSDLQTMPVRALARLLGELPAKVIRPQDVLPLMKRPEAEAREAAATALGWLGSHQRRYISALEKGLRDPEPSVALASSRALLRLGQHKQAKAVLLSTEEGQEMLAEYPDLIHSLAQEVRAGRLATGPSFRFLKNNFNANQFIETAREGLRYLTVVEARLAGECLVDSESLAYLPELLKDSHPNVREMALHALERMTIGPEQLAQVGPSLPLRQVETTPRLHFVVVRALQAGYGWTDPRMNPVLIELSRAACDPAALAVVMLGQAYAARGEDELVGPILAALNHPLEAVRLEALSAASSLIPSNRWNVAAGVSQEAQLLKRGAEFADGRLSNEILLESLACHRPTGRLFLPTRRAQLLQLLSLLKWGGVVGRRAQERVLEYEPDPDATAWRAILRAEAYHYVLCRKWPRLIVYRLLRGCEKLMDWGKAAQPGLLLALSHRSRTVRSRALQRMLLWPDASEFFHARVTQMAGSDPDPEVRGRAEYLLAWWRA